MNFLTTTLVGRHVAETAARLAGNNPLIRTGASAIATRWALRSLPAGLALVAAGTALRYYLDRRKKAEQQQPLLADKTADQAPGQAPDGLLPGMPAEIVA